MLWSRHSENLPGIQAERERGPPCNRGLWPAPAEAPTAALHVLRPVLGEEGKVPVSCAILAPDTENRCPGSHDRDLAAAGRGSSLERRMPHTPFPAVWLSYLGGGGWKQQTPLSNYTSGNLP